MAPRSLPTGTVTFLFTDVERSTELLDRMGAPASAAIARHEALLRACVENADGVVVKDLGDGILAAFESAASAVTAAVDGQHRLAAEAWPSGMELRARMGLHVGQATPEADDYAGIEVHRAARIMATAGGGQIVASALTLQLAGDLPAGVTVRDLGARALRGLDRPEPLVQLVVPGVPGSEAEVTRPVADGDGPGNVPAVLTSIIGRRAEADGVVRMLEVARILTITGPGGVGKTRLALEVVRRVRDGYPDGVWFVDLVMTGVPGLLAPSVLAVLPAWGIRDARPEEALRAVLADRQALIVLDGFEHLGPAAPLVAQLAGGSERSRVLVTSRAPLRVRGEQVIRLDPLAVARGARDDAATGPSPAATLFAERASAADPSFQLEGPALRLVEDICRRLDGLPLAIELAAARVRVVPLPLLRDRLDDRLALGPGPADLPDRHRTVSAAIDGSVAVLDAATRRTFGRLGVFAASWTLDAAEAVVASGEGERAAVLEQLAGLVDQSLVRLEVDPTEARWTMLGLIRARAVDELGSDGQAEVVRGRHAGWVCEVVESLRPRVMSHDGEWVVPRLERLMDDVRAAVAWCVTADEALLGLRIATAILPLAQVHNWWLGTQQELLRSVLDLPGVQGPPTTERANALGAAAQTATWLGDRPLTERYAQASLDDFRALGDDGGVADQLTTLGYALMGADRARARALQEEGLAIYRRLDHPSIGFALAGLSAIAIADRDPDRAEALGDEAAVRMGPLAETIFASFLDMGRGGVAQLRGDLAGARTHFAAALRRGSRAQSARITASALLALALCRLDTGDAAEAFRIAELGHRIRAENGLGPDAIDVMLGIEDTQVRAAAGLTPDVAAAIRAEVAAVPLAEAIAAIAEG